MTQYVYDFAEGDKDQQGPARRQGREPRRDDPARAAGAARLHHHDRGVPARTCAAGHEPAELRVQVTMALRRLEDQVGRRLGDRHDPLLVSVRSGAKFSMPGMMETVLNVGLNDCFGAAGWPRRRATSGSRGTPTAGWCRCSARPCWTSTATLFADALDAGEGGQGRRRPTSTWTPATCKTLVERFKEIVVEHAGREFPQDPREQLDLAIAGGLRLVEHRPRARCTAGASGSPTTSAPP